MTKKLRFYNHVKYVDWPTKETEGKIQLQGEIDETGGVNYVDLIISKNEIFYVKYNINPTITILIHPVHGCYLIIEFCNNSILAGDLCTIP